MRFIYFLIFTTLFVLTGCNSKKKTAKSEIRPAPAWITTKPADPFYYHGIGVSPKYAYSANYDYKQVAKNNALNDLASEISVKVNASSLLSQVEVNRQFSESFVSNTQVTSTEDLEGFELVDTYETPTHYYVFYRLSKEEHERRKALKRERALAAAADFLSAAEEFRNKRDAYQAYLLYIKSMEAIKSFWSEPLEYTYQGNRIFFGNHLISRIIGLLNEMQIQSSIRQIQITRGRSIDDEQFEIFVTFQNIRQPSIPVRLSYSGGRLRNPNQKTNAAGAVFIDLGRVTSTAQRERITAVINVEAWTSEATQNQQIIALMNQLRLKPFVLDVIVQSPSFFFVSDERAFGRPFSSAVLTDALKMELAKDQFQSTVIADNADFIVSISSDVEDVGFINRMSNVQLSFRIHITDRNFNVIYTRNVKNIRGIQTDEQSAARDAYNKAVRLIQRELYLEIRRNFIE
ncbi:MAG: LPP20 family lipoprotein [Thermaurantimonas sp.]|uniref:LPP20 family lipoprotein n=1 Tax=Thermaurantimonas sp. TaxID=2681568 RepID=UPI003918DF07